jgi:hypothetical protein
MLDLRTQMRIYVEDTVERIDSDDVVAAVSSGSVAGERRAWYARPTWVATGAAVLMLIAIGLPILLISNDEPFVADQVTTTMTTPVTPTPTVTTPVAPFPSVVTTTTSAVPLNPARLGVTWQQAPTQPAFGPNDVVRSVVEGGPGLVAVGGTWNEGDPRSRQWEAVIWTSVDGIAWERASDVPLLAGEVLTDVTAGPAGFVAVGGTYPVLHEDPSVLVSQDGESWMRIPPDNSAFPPDATPGAVTDGGPGYVAVGSHAAVGSGGPGQGAIWTSTDGISWTRIEQALGEGYEFSSINDIVNTGSVLVAIGSAWEDRGDYGWVVRAQNDLLIWTSTDGQVWKRGMLSGETGAVNAVTAHDGSIVAVGYEGVTLTAWLAEDASEAFTARQIPGFASAATSGVLGDGNRLLVVGHQGFGGLGGPSYAMAWASQDGGTTWYEITFEGYSIEGPFGTPSDQRPAGFHAVTAFGDGFVAVGSTGNPSAPVWMGTWNEK